LKPRGVVRVFFDSSVLVYAYSADDSHRRAIAADLVARHTLDGSLVISVQVMMETYNVLTRRKSKLPPDVLATLRLLATNEVVSPDAEMALLALTLGANHQLSTWDSLIVQAALEAHCEVLYSEDLQAGRRFGALEVVNPFLTQAHEPSPSLGPLPVTSRSKAKRAREAAIAGTGPGRARTPR
jgi:predicted nucleic acid-binding protein